ncbi:YihY family inner membrane protein [Pseudorhodoferax sp.]|uniref:YihY family inner membrane protein n=1 Tax=Pseudorhodoferax sp. TaxID=1993553 RepID=UPI0039E247AB
MPAATSSLSALIGRLRALPAELAGFPWRTTALTLRERFREDQLALTASSLTFTTTLALVPLFTVALAVFTVFPMFHTLQSLLQRWLVQSLVPETIARQVLGYLTQFASQASRLGGLGLALVLATALALVLTIDRTLNRIWRVRRVRPLGQRVLIYWALITLGPLLLGASLALTSYAISSSRGLVDSMPGGVRVLLDALEFGLLALGMAALYRYVPNSEVKWSHALCGGITVAVGIELAKRLLSLYIGSVPTYSAMYGTFATAPILLMWIYLAWLIVLLGAVIAAYLPSVVAGVSRPAAAYGWHFHLAIEVLQQLHAARAAGVHGLTASELARRLGTAGLQLEPALGALVALDWVARLDDAERGAGRRVEARHVLLADPDRTPLAPLFERLLVDRSAALAPLWGKGRWDTLLLRDALP